MQVVVAANSTDDAHVVTEAAELADAFADELHVLTVLDLEEVGDDIGPGGPDEAATERLEQEAKKRAAEIATEAGVDDVRPVGAVSSSVARSVLEYAQDGPTRYIVIGGRKRSPVGKALFGSTGQKVLLEASVPVVSVRASE